MSEPDVHDTLRASSLAAELTDTQCRALAGLVTLRHFADGELVVREGTSDSHLYLIVTGSVTVA
ncbi:MAG: hypothetical protein OEU94_17775, partial [Aquincola sp.]|nr:hypothetical protein [Aquincola sp.]